MTDPGLRDQLLNEGRKQARIHGVDMECAEVYAEGWRAAVEAAQPAVEERERELSLARRELNSARVEVSNAHYWRDTARKDRDVAQRELAGAKERIKIRDETIRDLREDIARLERQRDEVLSSTWHYDATDTRVISLGSVEDIYAEEQP